MSNGTKGKTKRRFYLIVALMLTAVITGWTYANTYASVSEAVGVTAAEAEIATVGDAVSQPDWGSILVTEVDTEVFRPNAAGDETILEGQYPVTGAHWDKVDETVSDGDSTYVETNDSNWREDLYNIANHSTQTAAGTISFVKVYMVCRVTASATQTNAYVLIRTNGEYFFGAEETLTTSYATYSYQWDTNPQTSAGWTWDEIDALQIGVGLRRPDVAAYARCTQIYAEVGFEAPPLSGDAPTGDLFEVSPNAAYSGDLMVKVYLVNTGNLTKAYQFLNMELYLEGSVEAGETPNYRILSLENGVASFKLAGGSSGDYTLSVVGGDYTLTSREPDEWEVGWTVTPELYCEATQR